MHGDIGVWARHGRRLRDLAADERGVTAIEYGLIAACIAVAIIVGVLALGGNVGDMFTTTSDAVDQAIGG